MIREEVVRFVASAATGAPTRRPRRPRRGNDYSILCTDGPALSYPPIAPPMERAEGPALDPPDRIGQLTMRYLDIAERWAELELYARPGARPSSARRA